MTDTNPTVDETDAPTPPPSIDELTAQLAQARAAEAERLASEQAAALERERSYRKAWLESYDKDALLREVVDTRKALNNAEDVSTALNALVDHQVARRRQHRAAQIAYNHSAWLANDAGKPLPRDEYGSSELAPLYPSDLADLINRVVNRAVDEWQQADDQQYADAVYGTGLTQEEILQAEQEAERRRRQELARPAVAASVDASGWTEAQREAYGLPPSRTRPQPEKLG